MRVRHMCWSAVHDDKIQIQMPSLSIISNLNEEGEEDSGWRKPHNYPFFPG